MQFGKTVAHLRKQKGLTQVELAEQVEVHPSLVTRWERGLVQPRRKALDRLARVLDTTVQELMSGDPDKLSASLGSIDDPELLAMFGQVHKLDERERDALKVVIGAILTRAQVAEVIHR
ncbi:XRE family transcriptional regulator [bacterium CPR1]|nr:XRE family transcriptional regulator [bacterium CPR1]